MPRPENASRIKAATPIALSSRAQASVAPLMPPEPWTRITAGTFMPGGPGMRSSPPSVTFLPPFSSPVRNCPPESVTESTTRISRRSGACAKAEKGSSAASAKAIVRIMSSSSCGHCANHISASRGDGVATSASRQILGSTSKGTSNTACILFCTLRRAMRKEVIVSWTRWQFFDKRRLLLRSMAAGSSLAVAGGLREVLAQGVAPGVITRDASRPQLPYGVMSGDVTRDRATVWSKTDRPSRLVVEYAFDEAMTKPHRIVGPTAMESTDYTARADLTGLPAGRRVFYRAMFQDLSNTRVYSEPLIGRLSTPPARRNTITFAFSGDA